MPRRESWKQAHAQRKALSMEARKGSTPRIVAGVDGSPSSLAALRWAVRQAELTGATVDAVIAWHYPVLPVPVGPALVAMIDSADFQKAVDATVTEAISSALDSGSDVQVIPRVREGNAAQVLLDAAADADLLVVGSRGHGGFTEALLGSVSQHCVHHAECAVVIVRESKGDGCRAS
jgi:nucleotide-binding universal stress UspA family protein